MWRTISLVAHFSYKSLSIFKNFTPRCRSRTTKIVIPESCVSSGSHFSAETPIDFATSQARNSPNTIKLVGPEPSFFDPNWVQSISPLAKIRGFEIHRFRTFAVLKFQLNPRWIRRFRKLANPLALQKQCFGARAHQLQKSRSRSEGVASCEI